MSYLWRFKVVASRFMLTIHLSIYILASKSVSKIQAQLTSGLTYVLSWLQAYFLILNLEKMKIRLVGTHERTMEADDLVIEISNTR